MELHAVPGFNETEGDGYTFVDDGPTAEVRVSLPRGDSSVSTSDIVVETLTESTLKVAVRGTARPIVDCEDLWAPIRHKETTWTLDPGNGELVVYLTKSDENEPWGALTKDAKTNEAAKAFAQLEKIKKLFETTREGTPALFDAVLGELVQDSGEKDFPVDQVRDGNQKNALHFAAQLGNLDLCKHLVEFHEVPLDAQDVEGETPLSLSSASGQAEVVTYLLESGASPNPPNPSPSPCPIHRAAMSGDLQSLRKLVDHGADVNSQCDLGTPLQCAAGSGNTDCVSFLLTHSVNLELCDESGVTPLVASVAAQNQEIVGMLLGAGADPNATATNGATALHIAAYMDNTQAIGALLSHGANPVAKDKDKLMPIHAAAVCEARGALRDFLKVTKRIPGVQWSVDGLIQDAKMNDGYVKDFTIEELGGEDQSSGMRMADLNIKVVDADKATAYKAEADGEFRKGKFQEAIRLYSASIEQDNSNAAAFANRSAAQIQLKSFESALEDAVVARTLKPDYMKAYYREGISHQALGNWEEAAQAYFEGCRIENENTELVKRFQNAMKIAKEQHRAKAQTGDQ